MNVITHKVKLVGMQTMPFDQNDVSYVDCLPKYVYSPRSITYRYHRHSHTLQKKYLVDAR